MFRIFQLIDHGGGIIFHRDMAVAYDIYNHICLKTGILSLKRAFYSPSRLLVGAIQTNALSRFAFEKKHKESFPLLYSICTLIFVLLPLEF